MTTLEQYSVDEIINGADEHFIEYLTRHNPYKPNGRSPDEMLEDRLWGDFSEWAFSKDTGLELSGIKYQDFKGPTNLFGIEMYGTIELKTIPRPDDTAATTAISNYMNKGTAGNVASFFVVYWADRTNDQLIPYGIWQRGFANAIVRRARLYPTLEILDVDPEDLPRRNSD